MTLIQREKIEQIRATADRIVYEYTLSVFAKMLAEVGGKYIEYTVYQNGHVETAELKAASYTSEELWNKYGTTDLDIINAGNEEYVTLKD